MKLASLAVVLLYVIVLFINYDSTRSDGIEDSSAELYKRERMLSILKRKLVRDALDMEARADDSNEKSNEDDDDDGGKKNANANDDNNGIMEGNKYKSIGSGITIPLANGDSVNICDGKYIAVAAAVHERIRDLLISACSGASGIL